MERSLHEERENSQSLTEEKKNNKKGAISKRAVENVKNRCGKLGISKKLKYRYLNISEGVAIGSAEFIADIQEKSKRKFIRPRKFIYPDTEKGRQLKENINTGLCTTRVLRALRCWQSKTVPDNYQKSQINNNRQGCCVLFRQKHARKHFLTLKHHEIILQFQPSAFLWEGFYIGDRMRWNILISFCLLPVPLFLFLFLFVCCLSPYFSITVCLLLLIISCFSFYITCEFRSFSYSGVS